MKRNNEKIRRKKKSFPTHKTCFFFHSYWTPFIFKASNFFISPLFLNDLKCYRSTTLISTNHMWSLIATKQYTILVSWLGLVFVVFGGLFFFLSSSPPLLWGAITFSILIPFFDDFQICQQEGLMKVAIALVQNIHAGRQPQQFQSLAYEAAAMPCGFVDKGRNGLLWDGYSMWIC